MNKGKPLVIVAVLDWGLGHATRCMPIIHELLNVGCKVVIAGNGQSGLLLTQTFPALPFCQLPGYNVHYQKLNKNLPLVMAVQLPKILRAIRNEKHSMNDLVLRYKPALIISDNRYGCWHSDVPGILITHQIHVPVKNAFFQRLINRQVERWLNNFDKVWVPDVMKRPGISGDLSHPDKVPTHVRYIGPLSRFEILTRKPLYTVTIILSGPEPARSDWETQLITQLKGFDKKVLLIRGLPGQVSVPESSHSCTVVNHMNAEELNDAICSSELIICRSGYTSVMDLIKLRKKAILVPTPQQPEQEYLAKILHTNGFFLSIPQNLLDVNAAVEVAKTFPFKDYSGYEEKYKSAIGDALAGLLKAH